MEVSMGREITSHKLNGCNEAITITVRDEPGSGGANHEYGISLNAGGKFHSFTISSDGTGLLIPFQKGPINEVGPNGITQEVLLAICIDRLQCFQNGPYKCRENAIALTHLEDAMHWLQHRTRARLARGVEGTHTV
jgi:hypothetical protein